MTPDTRTTSIPPATQTPPQELTLQSEPASIAPVRKWIEALAKAAGLEDAACFDLGLCVNEALANVIRHAYGGAGGKPILIRATNIDNGLEVTIRDWGNGVNPAELPEKPHDPNRPGGLGLICLRRMMNEVHFVPQGDGMLLVMRKRKEQPGGATPAGVPRSERT